MIGIHEDCPTRIYIVEATDGDGVFVSSVSSVAFCATFEAAEDYMERRRGYGPLHVFEYKLRDGGQYERSRNLYRSRTTGQIVEGSLP